jgi:hypothetical protein
METATFIIHVHMTTARASYVGNCQAYSFLMKEFQYYLLVSSHLSIYDRSRVQSYLRCQSRTILHNTVSYKIHKNFVKEQLQLQVPFLFPIVEQENVTYRAKTGRVFVLEENTTEEENLQSSFSIMCPKTTKEDNNKELLRHSGVHSLLSMDVQYV